jgi:hypothetical protein
MSFWDTIKNAGSSVFNAGKNLFSRLAPSIGQAIGTRFGGTTGGNIGSSLGNMVQGLTGGSPHSLARGYSGMGQVIGNAGGENLVNAMPAWMQKSTLGNLGGNAGAQAGAHAGQALAGMLPEGMKSMAPVFQTFGGMLGRSAGNHLHRQYGPKFDPQTESTRLGEMPTYLGGRAGAKAYNRTDIGKQQAAENMANFAELPGLAGGGYAGYAGGGYVSPDMSPGFSNHHAMHTMPYMGGGHGPVMFNQGGFADGGFNPPMQPQFPSFNPQMQQPQQMHPAQMAYGGYAGGGYAGGGQPISLHELVEMLPYGGGH